MGDTISKCFNSNSKCNFNNNNSSSKCRNNSSRNNQCRDQRNSNPFNSPQCNNPAHQCQVASSNHFNNNHLQASNNQQAQVLSNLPCHPSSNLQACSNPQASSNLLLNSQRYQHPINNRLSRKKQNLK